MNLGQRFDEGSNRFPLIAYHQLKRAQLFAELVLPDPVYVAPKGKRTDARHDKRRMEVNEASLVCIVASAAAVETEILSIAFFLHHAMLDRATPEEAKRFGDRFIASKDGYASMMASKECYVKGAKGLYKFATELAGAFKCAKQWPADAYEVIAGVRNRIIHKSIWPMKAPGRAPLALHPGLSLSAAEQCFNAMCACLDCLNEIHGLRQKDDQFENAMTALKHTLLPRDKWQH